MQVCAEVCRFVHQSFIATPLLIKLVHFQGYPLAVLPIAVEGVTAAASCLLRVWWVLTSRLCDDAARAGIPSMHACLDFLPELLQQHHLEQQVS